MNMTDGFVFYASFLKALETLPDDERLKAYDMICRYALYEETPEGTGPALGMFYMAQAQIDANRRRRENGQKGGRPKTEEKAEEKQTETKAKPKRNQSVTKAKPKEKVKEKEKEKEKEKDILSGKPDNPPLMIAVGEVIDYLNAKAGTNYQRHNRSAADLIKGRLSEKHTVDDFKKVIDKMTAAWKDDPKMCGYLRPSTLFAKAHFDEYLNQPDKPPNRKTAFHNFPQRQDNAALVQQLIAAQR